MLTHFIEAEQMLTTALTSVSMRAQTSCFLALLKLTKRIKCYINYLTRKMTWIYHFVALLHASRQIPISDFLRPIFSCLDYLKRNMAHSVPLLESENNLEKEVN